jgi:hypothetical protein
MTLPFKLSFSHGERFGQGGRKKRAPAAGRRVAFRFSELSTHKSKKSNHKNAKKSNISMQFLGYYLSPPSTHRKIIEAHLQTTCQVAPSSGRGSGGIEAMFPHRSGRPHDWIGTELLAHFW